MSFFSSQKVSVRKKEKRIAESHIVLPFVLLSSSGPSSPRLSEAWDKTRFGLLGNFPNIREVPRVFAEGEW